MAHPHPYPDAVFVRGTLLTMDTDQPEATAFAVSGERLIAVGSDDDILALKGPGTAVCDLDGAFACPGFHDSHNHMLSTGLGMLVPSLAQCRRVSDVLGAVSRQADTLAPGQWVVTAGDWHEGTLEERRVPLLRELDRAAPDHPVVLRRGGHNIMLNSRAMDLFGIREDSMGPDGATYVRASDGRLTGQIIGNAHVTDLLDRLPKPTLEDYRRALALVQSAYSRSGLTSVLDPGLTLGEIEAYGKLRAEGALRLRVGMLWRVPPPGTRAVDAAHMIRSGEIRADRSDPWLRILGVKICVDGGVETGFYTRPYARVDDPAHACGKPFLSHSELEELCVAANDAGLAVGAHCVGDAGIDLALDAFAAAARQRPIDGSRWSLIHMLAPREDHWDRLNDLGVGIAAQEPLHYALGAGFREYLGPERAAGISPLRDFLDRSRLPVGGGSDSPVAPFAPLAGIAASVTRRTRSAGVLGPEQAITAEEALRMYTRGSAWCAGSEQITGQLSPGYLADVVVLDRDPRSVTADDIADVDVRLTVVGGTVTHGTADGGALPR